MVSKVETFRALHQGRAPGDPLVLPGPWDAVRARGFETPALAFTLPTCRLNNR
ncbi:hypothetical protein GCM10010307_14580 [Streptomyces vastus]|uniref:Uncharacterized protein n=1 Tax=Streptomyces vastus TaxID=285451 RepID=A0ABP6CS09_9ACTN